MNIWWIIGGAILLLLAYLGRDKDNAKSEEANLGPRTRTKLSGAQEASSSKGKSKKVNMPAPASLTALELETIVDEFNPHDWSKYSNVSKLSDEDLLGLGNELAKLANTVAHKMTDVIARTFAKSKSKLTDEEHIAVFSEAAFLLSFFTDMLTFMAMVPKKRETIMYAMQQSLLGKISEASGGISFPFGAFAGTPLGDKHNKVLNIYGTVAKSSQKGHVLEMVASAFGVRVASLKNTYNNEEIGANVAIIAIIAVKSMKVPELYDIQIKEKS